MRVLFDQGTPVPLRQFLSGHSVSTTYELGWATLKNGELLISAEEQGFEVIVTTDTNKTLRPDKLLSLFSLQQVGLAFGLS